MAARADRFVSRVPVRDAVTVLVALVALEAASCSGAAKSEGPGRQAKALPTRAAQPEVDSTTLALWHMDDGPGDLARDAGPHGFHGLAGEGAAVVAGQFGGARLFDGDIRAYVLIPWQPALKDLRSFTVEAWIRPSIVTTGGVETIVAQWTSLIDRSSWYFGLVGDKALSDMEIAQGARIADTAPYTLVFAYVSRRPGETDRVHIATSEYSVLPGVWSHVAVSYEPGVVGFYCDHQHGRDESNTDFPDRINQTDTQITVGGFFDFYVPHRSHAFHAEVEPGWAFNGEIDEIRISAGVRQDLYPAVGRR
jgi:concanavalin A-like lectin/glucanase superfamily protein